MYMRACTRCIHYSHPAARQQSMARMACRAPIAPHSSFPCARHVLGHKHESHVSNGVLVCLQPQHMGHVSHSNWTLSHSRTLPFPHHTKPSISALLLLPKSVRRTGRRSALTSRADTALVHDFSHEFELATNFTGPLDAWDVSSATTFTKMFRRRVPVHPNLFVTVVGLHPIAVPHHKLPHPPPPSYTHKRAHSAGTFCTLRPFHGKCQTAIHRKASAFNGELGAWDVAHTRFKPFTEIVRGVGREPTRCKPHATPQLIPNRFRM